MIIALHLLAACVGLLIGFALWFAVRLHIAEDAVATHTKLLFDSGVKRDELKRGVE